MQFFKKTPNYDFMGRRRFFGACSAIAVLLSLAAVFVIGPKFGIDFMGGTEIQISFKGQVDAGEVRATLDKLGFRGSDVQTYGAHESEYLIRLQAISPVSDEKAASAQASFKGAFAGNEVSRFELSPGGDKVMVRLAKEVPIAEIEKAIVASGLALGERVEVARLKGIGEDGEEAEEEAESSKRCESVTCMWPHQEMQVYEVNLKGVADNVMDALRAESYGAGATKMRSEWVGPKVGRQLRVAGVSSVGFALLFIMLYIAIRFDLRYAPGAIVALIHDVIITMGVFTVLQIDVTLATVAALLTIVGYSLNDTIVVFDRIRENVGRVRDQKLSDVINQSVNQTLSRTILTSLTTLIVVVVLIVIGWRTTIRDFSLALLIGIIVGTYSSIFIASPIVAWLDARMGKKKA